MTAPSVNSLNKRIHLNSSQEILDSPPPPQIDLADETQQQQHGDYIIIVGKYVSVCVNEISVSSIHTECKLFLQHNDLGVQNSVHFHQTLFFYR